MSSRLQLIALEQEFPAVDPSVVQLVADSCGGRINVIKERLKSMAQDQANNEREGAFRSSLSDALRSEFPQLQASIVTDVLESCNWNEETARDQLFHLAISNSFDSTIKELTEYYSRHGISQELVAAIMEECNDREVAVEFLETLKLEPQPSLLESPSQQVPEAFLWETFPEIDKDFLTSIFAGVGGDVTRAVDSILVILDETADQVVDPPANASSTPPQEISELPTIDELKSRFPREADSTLRDLKSLAELFPNASLESLRKTLVSARYDSALAAEILFARPPSPSLSSQGSNSLQPLTSWQLPLNGKLKVDLLMKQYPWMDRDLMEDLFVQHNQNVTQTVQAVGEVFHLPRSPGKPAANTVLKRSDPVLRGPSGLPTFRQAGSTIPTPPPRTPGFSTSYNYVSRDLLSMSEKELLSAGHQAAASRSRLFQEAGAAYQRGDKVLCKRLGDEARSLEVRMREAQKLAAEKVSSLFTRASEGAIPQLDLHGFHVEEALELLEDTLHRLSTRSDAAALRVITGAGYHSGERGPRIKPAVVSYLRRHNLPNYAIGAGAFMVILASDFLQPLIRALLESKEPALCYRVFGPGMVYFGSANPILERMVKEDILKTLTQSKSCRSQLRSTNQLDFWGCERCVVDKEGPHLFEIRRSAESPRQ